MIEGHFIVLEGIDGSGTTTQVEILAERLKNRGLPAHPTREPSDGPIGVLIRQILTGRTVVPSPHGTRAPGWATMAALFAADRLDHLESEIAPNLHDGVTVICDRYDHSSVAYQTVSSDRREGVSSWVLELNRHARRPDLTLVLDVDPEVAAARRGTRPGGPELYEVSDLQVELSKFYRKIDELFPNDTMVHIDANQSVDHVAKAVWTEVMKLRGEST